MVVVALEAVAIVVLAVFVAGLLRSHAELVRMLHDAGIASEPARRVPGPPARSSRSGAAPDVTGVAPDGTAVSVSLTAGDGLTLLVFLSTGCLTCRSYWDALASREPAVPGATRSIVVTRGPDEESPAAVAALAPPGVLTVMSSEAWDAHGVPGSPYVRLIDARSGDAVGEGTAPTWDAMTRLLGQALDDAAMAEGGAVRGARPSVDDELRRAGIHAGHPSLSPERGDARDAG
jgi:hypothetical protein